MLAEFVELYLIFFILYTESGYFDNTEKIYSVLICIKSNIKYYDCELDENKMRIELYTT